jgi:hypothetical protein
VFSSAEWLDGGWQALVNSAQEEHAGIDVKMNM